MAEEIRYGDGKIWKEKFREVMSSLADKVKTLDEGVTEKVVLKHMQEMRDDLLKRVPKAKDDKVVIKKERYNIDSDFKRVIMRLEDMGTTTYDKMLDAIEWRVAKIVDKVTKFHSRKLIGAAEHNLIMAKLENLFGKRSGREAKTEDIISELRIIKYKLEDALEGDK